MNFFSPWYFVGLLGLALPVYLHWIHNRPRTRREFSSLMFLESNSPPSDRRQKFDQLFLLLLRCLIFILLALAFTRPFFTDDATKQAPSGRARHLFVLLDVSASMKRPGLWNQAVERLEAIASELREIDKLTVYAFDQQVRELLPVGTPADSGALDRLKDNVNAIKPGWGGSVLDEAMIFAAEELAIASPEKNEKESGTQPDPVLSRGVVVISDFQAGLQLSGLQGYEWPDGVKLRLETVTAKAQDNAGLNLMTGSGSKLFKPSTAFRVRVQNSPESGRDQFELTFEQIGGPGKVSTNTVSMKIHLPPGKSRVVSSPIKIPQGQTARVRLAGDELDFDNQLFLVQGKTNPVRVVYAGADDPREVNGLHFYLAKIFDGAMGDRVDFVWTKLVEADTSSWVSQLRDAALLVLTGQLNTPQAETIKPWIERGGSTLLVMKNASMAPTLGALAGVPGMVVKERELRANDYFLLEHLNFDHPWLAAFKDSRFNDFSNIHFWKYREVDAGLIPESRVLASFDSGDPAWIEVPREQGRLLAMMSGWNPEDSQLALSSKFVPLMVALVSDAIAQNARALQFAVGDEIDFEKLFARKSEGPLTFISPGGTEQRLTVAEPVFRQTKEPGVYRVLDDDTETLFAVNLHSSESRVELLDPDVFANLGLPVSKLGGVDVEDDTSSNLPVIAGATGVVENEYWRWALGGLLIFTLLETIVAGAKAKSAQAGNDSQK